MYTTAHSEKYWHAPLEFHPERWLPQGHTLHNPIFANDNKDASNPFSIGPRACIGINLAYTELRIVLSRLAWQFDWELLDQNINWLQDTVLLQLWKKPELPIRFIPRADKY
jgi:cytochrome P450